MLMFITSYLFAFTETQDYVWNSNHAEQDFELHVRLSPAVIKAIEECNK